MATSRDDFIIAIRSAFLKKSTQQKFSLLTLVFISIFTIVLSSLDFKIIIAIEIDSKESKENFCWVLFFKKAERIAIIKSSILEAITLNMQST